MNEFASIDSSGAELKDFYGKAQLDAIRIKRKKKSETLTDQGLLPSKNSFSYANFGEKTTKEE